MRNQDGMCTSHCTTGHGSCDGTNETARTELAAPPALDRPGREGKNTDGPGFASAGCCSHGPARADRRGNSGRAETAAGGEGRGVLKTRSWLPLTDSTCSVSVNLREEDEEQNVRAQLFFGSLLERMCRQSSKFVDL